MAALQWSDALVLDAPAMDRTHEEFVVLLAAVEEAEDADLLPRWQALIAHTDAHFAREDHWMRASGFATGNCHSVQHQVVLQAMREGLAGGRTGELAVVRDMARQLGLWFVQHAQSMDAGLALHLRSQGFDMETGEPPPALMRPVCTLQGCGTAACSSADTLHRAHAAEAG